MQENIQDKPSSDLVEARFNALATTEIGMYSLIDYVNFKGEGTSLKERYNGYGWGLKQVLLEMDTHESTIHDAFAKSCIDVLTRRINNSPQKDVEMRWLQGWSKRCNTYKQI